jgi:predicted secreted protein
VKLLLTNEERLRRKRERWAKQAAERRKPGSEFKAYPEKGRTHQRRSGRRERAEVIISAYTMQVAERYFWLKRGIELPP